MAIFEKLYKPETTLPAAFESVAMNPNATEDEVIVRLKGYIEKTKLLSRMPTDVASLLEGL